MKVLCPRCNTILETTIVSDKSLFCRKCKQYFTKRYLEK
jgi:phage FluMu protein Com